MSNGKAKRTIEIEKAMREFGTTSSVRAETLERLLPRTRTEEMRGTITGIGDVISGDATHSMRIAALEWTQNNVNVDRYSVNEV